MTGPIRIDFLGGVQISGCDTPLPARALTLLGYLVTRPGVSQPRGHLADLLWPGSGSAQARTNLRRELHHLRTALSAGDWLRVTATDLCWCDGPGCVVDVTGFLDAHESATEALDEGRDDAAARVEDAVAGYGGDFLPGCYDDWVVLTRDDLRARCVELCDRGAALHEERGDLAAGIELQRHQLGLEPLAEAGYRRLMRLQHAAGDRAGAMRTYHRCVSVLERELGLDPSPETRRQLDEVLRSTTAAGAAGPRSAPASDPLTHGDFGSRVAGLFGRESEQRRLAAAWDAASDPSSASGRVVLVTGEAGIGKTRLVDDLAARVARQDGVVATAHCFAATSPLPMAPVAQWLRHPRLRQAISRLPPVWRTEVERLVPLGEEEATGTPEGSRAKIDAWQRVRFFEGLARTVLAVDAPLLLVVEDLHWCDTASLSWLAFLLSMPTPVPLLVVGTVREDDQARSAEALAALASNSQETTLPVTPLSPEATGQLAERLLEHPLEPDELALVHSVTGGNPFFVTEAVREARASAGPVGPDDLRGVLASRISRLSSSAQQVLGLASAVGRDFGLDLLTEACDLDADTVVRAVDELWRRQIFDERGHGYDVSHQLLREVAYDAVPPARRWLLHRRLAQALELLYRDRTESVGTELAEQYDRSGQPTRALPFYELAAHRASTVFAHAEAVRLGQRARTLLLESYPSGRSRDERELGIIEQVLPPLNAWKGYSSTELEACERRSHELGRRLGLERVQVTASIALFATTYVQGHILESSRWAGQALALVERSPDLAGQAHMAVAGSGLAQGAVRAAAAHFELACALSGESDSLPIGTRTAVHARAWSAHARWLTGDEEGARSAVEESLRLARSIDHPYSLAVALAYAAITHQVRDDTAALGAGLDELTRVCERYGFAYYGEWAEVLTGWHRGGEQGTRLTDHGIRRLEAQGSLARMPYWLSLLADLHRSGGDTAGAIGILDAAETVALQNADVWWLPEVLRARAALDPTERGAEYLRRATRIATLHASHRLVRRCEADAGRRGAALTVPGARDRGGTLPERTDS